MINRKLSAVCTAVLLAVQIAFSAVCAYADGFLFKEQTDAVFSADCESRNAEGFFDKLDFGTSDWLAFCYGRLYGGNGSEEYISNVKKAVKTLQNENGFVRPTEYQRAAIVLSAFGECDSETMSLAVYNNDKLSAQGLNAYIWGLIAINSGNIPPPENPLNTADSIIDYLLSKQLEDGGFNLKGNGADCDITSAAIYALAPHKSNAKVAKALDRAVNALTALQQSDGGFMSIGVPNCESTAQAIIAFTSMGYGPDDKRTRLALNALDSYKAGTGYSHLAGGEKNMSATMQAAMAMTAAELYGYNRSLFDDCEGEFISGDFIYSPAPPQTSTTAASSTTITTVPDTAANTSAESAPESVSENSSPNVSESIHESTPESITENTDTPSSPQSTPQSEYTLPSSSASSQAENSAHDDEADTDSGKWYKIIIVIALAVMLSLLILLAGSAKGKAAAFIKKYSYIGITVLIFAAVLTVVFVSCDYNTENTDNSANTSVSDTNVNNSVASGSEAKYDYLCTFIIDCKTAVARADKSLSELLPEGGIIFSSEVGFNEGDTAFDILQRVCRENKIRLEVSYSPAFSSYYVEGISDLYEFDLGADSGWLYRINGKIQNYGCSSYKAADGDVIEFIYTCDMGIDIGGEQ